MNFKYIVLGAQKELRGEILLRESSKRQVPFHFRKSDVEFFIFGIYLQMKAIRDLDKVTLNTKGMYQCYRTLGFLNYDIWMTSQESCDVLQVRVLGRCNDRDRKPGSQLDC